MIRKLLSACTLLLLCSFAAAQDPALLRPPKGAQVALVVFQDLECPKCRIDSPLEEQAARAHKIPLVLHDFPLPLHKWSFNAAVIARYFDSQSKELGNQFRDYIFQHQPEITADNLQSFAQKFAAEGDTRVTQTSTTRKLVARNFVVDEAMIADFREQMKTDKLKIDEDAFAKDAVFIKAMIRFEIDNAVFGIADARRHLIAVDPQAQAALQMFGEAQKLTELGKGSKIKAH